MGATCAHGCNSYGLGGDAACTCGCGAVELTLLDPGAGIVQVWTAQYAVSTF